MNGDTDWGPIVPGPEIRVGAPIEREVRDVDIQDWRATHLNVSWRDDVAQSKTDDEVSLDTIIRERCGVIDIDPTAPSRSYDRCLILVVCPEREQSAFCKMFLPVLALVILSSSERGANFFHIFG